jgi:hypothetical protein
VDVEIDRSNADGPCLNPSCQQADKWTKAVREKLGAWVQNEALPVLKKYAEAIGVDVEFRVEGAGTSYKSLSRINVDIGDPNSTKISAAKV